MTHGSLFSGGGGFDLAAEWMGWTNAFHCEWNPFGQRILKYYWPDAESYTDITKTDFTIWRGRIDILTGGFPCQPFSHAGKRGGTEDNRYLWPSMLRAIQEIQPTWIVAENVPGILTIENGLVFERVCSEMEAEGYEVQPVIIPSCSTGADHKRDRVWFIANNISKRRWTEASRRLEMDGNILYKGGRDQGAIGCEALRGEVVTTTHGERLEGHWIERNSKGQDGLFYRKNPGGNENWLEAATRLCVPLDELSGRLDGITLSKWRTESLKMAGNAVDPDVVYEIFKAIQSSI